MPDDPEDVLDLLTRVEDAFGGYHTSVVEMSFAAIERSFEFYALHASSDSVDEFREGHERAYD